MINLNELSDQDIAALAQVALIGNRKVLDLLERFAATAYRQLGKADDTVRIHRLQGRVEAIEALGAAIKQAAKLS